MSPRPSNHLPCGITISNIYPIDIYRIYLTLIFLPGAHLAAAAPGQCREWLRICFTLHASHVTLTSSQLERSTRSTNTQGGEDGRRILRYLKCVLWILTKFTKWLMRRIRTWNCLPNHFCKVKVMNLYSSGNAVWGNSSRHSKQYWSQLREHRWNTIR